MSGHQHLCLRWTCSLLLGGAGGSLMHGWDVGRGPSVEARFPSVHTAAVWVHSAEAEALDDLSPLGRYQKRSGDRFSVSDQHRLTWRWLEPLGENSSLRWGVLVGREKCPGCMRKAGGLGGG